MEFMVLNNGVKCPVVGIGTFLLSPAEAQISLAWMLRKYPNVVPIPGSKNQERILENLDSAKVVLTEEEFTSLERELDGLKVYGHRGLGGF